MARNRIRSLHGDQWTDGDFACMSPHARLLSLAIRNFADDRGVIPWDPRTFRVRLLPGDSVDMDELLAEMVEGRQVMTFEDRGRTYLAIRNFLEFQSPRYARADYPLPNDLREWVGLPEELQPFELGKSNGRKVAPAPERKKRIAADAPAKADGVQPITAQQTPCATNHLTGDAHNGTCSAGVERRGEERSGVEYQRETRASGSAPGSQPQLPLDDQRGSAPAPDGAPPRSRASPLKPRSRGKPSNRLTVEQALERVRGSPKVAGQVEPFEAWLRARHDDHGENIPERTLAASLNALAEAEPAAQVAVLKKALVANGTGKAWLGIRADSIKDTPNGKSRPFGGGASGRLGEFPEPPGKDGLGGVQVH